MPAIKRGIGKGIKTLTLAVRSAFPTNPQDTFLALGDSLTYGGSPGRAPGIFDGRPWYGNTTITTLANMGGTGTFAGAGNWLNYAMVDGRIAAASANGTLNTNSSGWMRWTLTGDTAGPYVDVTQGGWYYLDSGTPNQGILVAIRGNTSPSVNTSTGVTTAGVASISEANFIGYIAWVAGAMGDTFSDYQAWGITGATTADILKYAPQALAKSVEAVSILAGVNDAPATDAACAATIANLKAIIEIARSKANRVYVNEIAPNPSATVVVNQYLAKVSDAIRAHCRTFKTQVRFISAFDRMANPNTLTIGGAVPLSNPGGRSGVFNPLDNLHFMPFGAYTFAKPLVDALQKDYQREQVRSNTVSAWSSTLGVGALNLNPCLRGSAGTGSGAGGITGPVPDSWTLTRSGSNQVCVASFDADPNGGMDWYSLSVSGAAQFEYHELNQIVTLPAGVTVGDYVQFSLELMINSTTSPGLAILQAQANGANTASYVFQLSRSVNTFTNELPVLHYRTEPLKILTGNTSFNLRIRVGANHVGGTGAGKVSFRKFLMEKYVP